MWSFWKLLYLLQVAIKSLNLFRIDPKNPVDHFTQIVLPGSFRQPTDQNFLGAVRDIFTYDQLCNSTIDNKAATLRDRTKDQTKDWLLSRVTHPQTGELIDKSSFVFTAARHNDSWL